MGSKVKLAENRDLYNIAASQKSKEKKYWHWKLSGEPVKSVFPYDHRQVKGNVKDIANDQTMGNLEFKLTGEIYSGLIQIGSGSNHLLHMVLTAALLVLLKRYAGGSDLMVCAPVLKQETDIPFINTILPLRVLVNNRMYFRELLLRVQETIIEATEHQNYPMQTLLEELAMPITGEGFPLADIAVLLENIHSRQYIEPIDLNMIFVFFNTGECIQGEVRYNESLYETATIERIINNYKQVLTQVVFNVDLMVSAIETLSPLELEKILYEFNRTDKEFPGNKRVHELFEMQAEVTPHLAGVIFRDKKVSYEVLNRQSARLALLLRKMGAALGVIIAVMFDWSIEVIIAVMAALRSGGVYLPIDPSYPPERIKMMLNDSNTQIVITTGDYDHMVRYPQKEVIRFEDFMARAETGQGAVEIHPVSSPHDPAYIIYTSGSTGRPKGIMIEHHSFTDFVSWAVEEFEHRQGYQVLLSNSYAFDGAMQQIFPPLVTGGTLHLLDPGVRMDPWDYYHYLKENRINNIDEVPAVINLLLENLELQENHELLPDLTSLSLGSEYVPVDVMRKCRKYLNHKGKIINAYGPAEASVETCTYHFDGSSEKEISLIGKPRQNLKVYILDPHLAFCPIGVPGQICISGTGLARGYLNWPELTSEKFDHDLTKSFLGGPGGRFFKKAPLATGGKLYKTGDRGRWHPDGNVEFLGRIDHQVKVRGFRVELEEIREQLLKHDAIKEAVVLAESAENEVKYICAYIVSYNEPGPSELREFLSLKLPKYMIPDYFMCLDHIPLTPNGKTDRKKLPPPLLKAGNQYISPQDIIEKRLVEIWSDVLSLEKESISVEANFFQLGGHSLKATMIISRIYKELEAKLPLAQMFKTPTIKELSRCIRELKTDTYVSIVSVEKKEYYDLSSAQKRLFILNKLENLSTGYNITGIHRVRGIINREKFHQVFHRLIQRHEAFRTSFEWINDNDPVQKIHDNVNFDTLETGARGKTEAEIINDFIRPFDLGLPPLLRIAVVQLRESEYLFLYDMHHIISDGISMVILIDEFSRLYNEEELASPKIQYKDFSAWQNNWFKTGKIKKEENYWLKLFSDKIPVLDMPVDFPRTGAPQREGAVIQFIVEKELTRKILAMVFGKGVTLYMLLLAVYNILLSKYTLQEDIIVGTPIAGRLHADLESVIGGFVNILAMRNFPHAHKSFSQFLEEVRENSLGAFENQHYQFEMLIDKLGINREFGRDPLFDTTFLVQNTEFSSTGMEIADFQLIPYEHGNPGTPFEMVWVAWEYDEQIYVSVVYSRQLYKQETIEKLMRHYIDILTIVARDDSIGIIDIDLGKDQQETVTATSYVKDQLKSKIEFEF